LNDVQSAQRYFRKAVSLDSLNVSYQYNLGLLLAKIGDVDGAIGVYKNILKADISFVPAYQQLGQLCETWLKETVPYRDSIWSRVLSYRPNDYIALYYHGLMMFRSNDPDSGMVCLKRATDQDSLFYAAIYELALRNLARKNLDEAFFWYARALRLRPVNAKLYSEVGSYYEKAGRRENARSCYLKAVSLDSMNATYAEQLGLIYFAFQRFDSAALYLKKAAILNKENWSYFFNLALAYEFGSTRSADLAVRAFNDAITAYDLPGCANIYHHLGDFYLNQKKYAEAKSCCERMIQLEPANPGHILSMAHVYRAMGNTDREKKEFQKYLDATVMDSTKSESRQQIQRYLKYLETQTK
jgi:tetratricopeptide (TPR) repeat protein